MDIFEELYIEVVCPKIENLQNKKKPFDQYYQRHKHTDCCIVSTQKQFALRGSCLCLVLQLITLSHIYAPHAKRPNLINSNN